MSSSYTPTANTGLRAIQLTRFETAVSVLGSADLEEKEECEAIDHAVARIDQARTLEQVAVLLEEDRRGAEPKNELTLFIEQCLASEDKIN